MLRKRRLRIIVGIDKEEWRAAQDRMPRPAEVGLHAVAGGGTAEEVGVSVDAAVLEREACGAGLGGDGVLLAAEGEACDDVAIMPLHETRSITSVP
uniref:DUF834 domain-containing protein n=1 Tax=Oryza rufipogon TaxID=4529 RepID=A0A0E0Q283_ORYRU